MKHQLDENVSLHVLPCAQCGVLFGATEQFLERKVADGTTFYCPSGHAMSYTEASDLRKQVSEAQRRLTESKCEIVKQRHRAELAESAVKHGIFYMLVRKLLKVKE